jgi:hypothetical protein
MKAVINCNQKYTNVETKQMVEKILKKKQVQYKLEITKSSFLGCDAPMKAIRITFNEKDLATLTECVDLIMKNELIQDYWCRPFVSYHYED